MLLLKYVLNTVKNKVTENTVKKFTGIGLTNYYALKIKSIGLILNCRRQ